MARYIIKRVAFAILTLFVLISLTFFMMRMLPGDPFLGDKTVSETTLANMNAKYGLDKPVFIQYLTYIGNCLRGDLGMSIVYNRDVMGIVSESFMVSADLGIRDFAGFPGVEDLRVGADLEVGMGLVDLLHEVEAEGDELGIADLEDVDVARHAVGHADQLVTLAVVEYRAHVGREHALRVVVHRHGGLGPP